MTALRLSDRRASLLSFSAALLLSLTLSACNKKQDRAPRQAAVVSVAPVKRATVPYVIEANGIVTPLQTVSVTTQVSGIITSVDFDEGQEVHSGQPLFHIDPRPYQNAYDQAVAVLARDSASWEYAKAEAERYKKMLTAKVVTPEEAGVQITSEGTAEATMRSDHASIEQAKFNLDNTVVRSPIDGKTGAILVRKGNLVNSGASSPLVVINQVRPILVRFAIPSSQLPLVLQYGAHGGLPVAAVPGGVAAASPSIDSIAASQMNPVGDPPGQSGATMRDGGAGNAPPGTSTSSSAGAGSPTPGGQQGGSANGVLQQGGITGDRLMGKLVFIDNAVDTSTATVQLKALFDNNNGRLWTGEYAATSLHLFDEDSVLVVPQQAVVTGQQGNYVYVVDPTDTARQRAVVVERSAGGMSIISSGVHEGESVVIDGQARLTPDAPVRFRGVDMPGGGQGGGRRGRGRKGGQGGGQGGNGNAANAGKGDNTRAGADSASRGKRNRG